MIETEQEKLQRAARVTGRTVLKTLAVASFDMAGLALLVYACFNGNYWLAFASYVMRFAAGAMGQQRYKLRFEKRLTRLEQRAGLDVFDTADD